MTPMGVSGIEDDDWQATSGPSDHNEYRGFSASKMSAGGFQNLGNTMTGYCTGCHGNFHIEDTLGDGTWERHPSDAVLPNSGEFANAFGAGGSGTGTYDPGVPVARPETGGTFDWSGADSNVYVGTGQDMAMCLSCHRAHGSPYPKMLRWDYTATAAPGPGSDRCFTCHTQKDHEGGGVSGPCRECHTMHNSEDGSDMQTGYDSTPGLGEVKSTLLRYNDCVGCHTAEDNTTAIDPDTGAPIVYNTVEPIANTLAGGNFWWVEQDTGDGLEDSKGHNAFSDNEDNNLTVAPGVPVGAQNTCGDPNTSCHFRLHNVDPSQGTRQGCTKCHMMRDNTFKEHHHADDSNIVVGSEGLDTDAFFRFIQGHMSGGGWGVSGIEDDDWEYTVSAADHNEYLGKSFEPKTYQQITPFTSIGTTMTAYCCGCHGVFHYEKDASNNWIRHPSDAVLPDSGEFDLYTVFNPDAPVARPATSATRDDFVNWSAADSEVVPGEDFVMCLSNAALGPHSCGRLRCLSHR
jgi:predicted CXXCH cytochrome family protein